MIKKLFFILFAAITVASCSSNDPIATAEKFAHAYLIEHDVNAYTAFLKETTREALLSPVMAEYHKQQQEKVKALKLAYTLDKEKTLINMSGASVYFNVTSATDPSFKENVRADLSQDSDGKWFIKYNTFPTRF